MPPTTDAELQPEDVIFYKIDHFGDPEPAGNRIILGVEACMKGLRATARPDQLIVAIGGRTAGRLYKRSRVLRDRLVWVGEVEEVVPAAAPDGRPLVVGRRLLGGREGAVAPGRGRPPRGGPRRGSGGAGRQAVHGDEWTRSGRAGVTVTGPFGPFFDFRTSSRVRTGPWVRSSEFLRSRGGLDEDMDAYSEGAMASVVAGAARESL